MNNPKSQTLACFALSIILLAIMSQCTTILVTALTQKSLKTPSDQGNSEITMSKIIRSSASKETTDSSVSAAEIGTKKHYDDLKQLTSTTSDENLNFIYDEKKFLEAAQNQTHEFLFEGKRREDAFHFFDAKHHPFAVVLVSNLYTICSGTLLTPDWVLTAAHCMARVSSWWVYGGLLQSAFSVNHQRLPPGVTVIPSREWYIHPNYNSYTFDHDVALVRLRPPFQLNAYIHPLRLTDSPWQRGPPRTCVFTGFGRVHWTGTRSQADFTRKTQQIQVGKPCPCEGFLRRNGQAVDRYICKTKSYDYGICGGDSGSGLVCNFRVCGVTSWLIDVGHCQRRVRRQVVCGHANTLSIFQDVYPNLPWIRKYVPPWVQPKERGFTDQEDSKNATVGLNKANSRYLRTMPLSMFVTVLLVCFILFY